MLFIENTLSGSIILFALIYYYLGFPKGEPKVNIALRYFYFFCLQSQIAIWALKHMCACLIRGQGIDLQRFIHCFIQSLGSFHRIPPLGKFCQVSYYYSCLHTNQLT